MVAAACMLGTGHARGLLLVEVRDGVSLSSAATLASLTAALADANGRQPSYSHVLPHHVMLLPEGALPRTVNADLMVTFSVHEAGGTAPRVLATKWRRFMRAPPVAPAGVGGGPDVAQVGTEI